MKRILAFLLMVILAVTCCTGAMADKMTKIKPNMDLVVEKPASIEDNPIIEGQNPFTGLPSSGEACTPVFVVLNNTEESYPHWGVGAADIIMQLPNMSAGNMKLAALYSDTYPALVGGTRSARMTMVPFAIAFDAAFASAGTGPNPSDWPDAPEAINVTHYLSKSGFKSTGTGQKYFNLLGNSYHESIKGFNVCHLNEVHEKLVNDGTSFAPRALLFTDEPLTRGDTANIIECKFYENSEKTNSNPASNCTFYYDDGFYVRVSAAGLNTDRESGQALTFTNLIVMRTTLKWKGGYIYYKDNLVGGGQADIFQNGLHITGAWYRDSETSRLIFLDDEGKELNFQRGKSFIIVDNKNAVVSYGE